MAEVARDGGTLVVNPRDSEDIAAAMEKLLSDDELLAALREEAAARVWPTWDDYASATWGFLTDGE
jgi:glycosyltransferase involved in cell wall biosynthesis